MNICSCLIRLFCQSGTGSKIWPAIGTQPSLSLHYSESTVINHNLSQVWDTSVDPDTPGYLLVYLGYFKDVEMIFRHVFLHQMIQSCELHFNYKTLEHHGHCAGGIYCLCFVNVTLCTLSLYPSPWRLKDRLYSPSAEVFTMVKWEGGGREHFVPYGCIEF